MKEIALFFIGAISLIALLSYKLGLVEVIYLIVSTCEEIDDL